MKAFSYILLCLLCGLSLADPKTPKERSLNKAEIVRSLFNRNFRRKRKERNIFFIQIEDLKHIILYLVYIVN